MLSPSRLWHSSSSCLQSSIPSFMSLERVDRDGDKVSRFDHRVLVVRVGPGTTTEVRIHERLSVPTHCMLHHALFFALVVVEPLNWISTGMWYLFVNECHGMRWARVCAGVGDEPIHTRDATWPGTPSFYGEQKRLVGRSFTASFIFGVDYSTRRLL
jgi:hypothetical protein